MADNAAPSLHLTLLMPIGLATAVTLALAMVALHRADGGEVLVLPGHVTSLHAKAPSTPTNKLVTGEARCVLWLVDGKVLAVLETCETVRKLLEEKR